MIEQFEKLRDAICANDIQHDTEIKYWNGVEPLQKGHIVQYVGTERPRLRSLQGKPAIVRLVVKGNLDTYATICGVDGVPFGGHKTEARSLIAIEK